MPVGWFPDPTPEVVVAPGWGPVPPVQTDPLTEVGWWALVGLDMGLTAASPAQVMQFEKIRGVAFAQAAASSQSASLQKIATLQYTNTATQAQTLAMQRIVTLQLANVAPAVQVLGLVKVIGLALAATGVGSQALGMVRVGTLALSQQADPVTALVLQKIVSMALANSTAPASQTLAALKIALTDWSSLGNGLFGAVGLAFPVTPEATTIYDVAGTYTYTIPRWCDWIDAVPLGGGEAGTNGGGGNGSGGRAGIINPTRWTRGLHVPFSALTMTVVVADKSGTNGSAGFNSTVTVDVTGGLVQTGAGGNGNMGATNPVGQAVADVTFNGVTYTGGASQGSLNGQGRPPGGGGAGGGFASAGGRGAIGKVWLRAGQG